MAPAKAPGKAVAGKKTASRLGSLKNMLLGSAPKKGAEKSSEKSKTLNMKGKGAPPTKSVVTGSAKNGKGAKLSAAGGKVPPQASPKAEHAKLTNGALANGAARAAKLKSAPMGASLISANLSRALNGQQPQDAGGEAVCREVACEGLATSGGYCRLHYIKNWKKIKRKEVILREGKLNQYIEELVAKYPDKYLEAIRQDLLNDKDFAKVIYDLDLDESIDDFEGEGENVESLIDNIKREFEDEGETF